MKETRQKDSTIHAAAFGAATLIAGQVAGKAVRDSFFLSRFEVSALPDMVILAALVSIAAGFVAARLIRSIALTRLVPIAFACSSALLLLEWWIAAWNPGAAAILIYLQMAVTGSLLISGFWSLLGDRFDPRSARKQFGRIVAASAFGGVIGGVLAERVGSALGIASMLPILAFLHLVTALIATGLSPERPTVPDRAGAEKRASLSSLGVLGKVPYVRNLALLILFSRLGAGLLDYVF
jgi:AAA family ATP:ADP antiporter